MGLELPPCPASLKQIQHFLKIAQEHDERDIVVAYWSRLYSLQVGLKLTAGKCQPDETKLLLAMMDWLEKVKKENADNEAISNEVAAQAHIENYALKLFLYADKSDRESNFGKNVVKAFYSSGVLYDILQTFGELSEEAVNNRKYAKWKAAYIHNCLKNGETPVPGPMQDEEGDENAAAGNDDNAPAGNDDNANADDSATAADRTPPSDEPPVNPTPPQSTISPPSDEALITTKLPSPPVEEEKPGGFEPFHPTVQLIPVSNLKLTDVQMMKAQKYTKYAGSALNYDDVKSAVENLQKALKLLTTGQDD